MCIPKEYATTRESNEGFFGGNDRENTPQDKVEKPPMIDPPQKRRKSKKYSHEIETFQDIDDMEVDTSKQFLDWVAIWLVKIKALVQELAPEDIFVFEDEFLTLHRARYQKDTRNILLQHVRIKVNHITNKWGLQIEIKNAIPSDVMDLH